MGIFSHKKWYESTLHYVKHVYPNRLVEKNTAAVSSDALLESQYWGLRCDVHTDLINK